MSHNQRRTCPLCESVTLNLSDHFSKVHRLNSQQWRPYLQLANKKHRITKKLQENKRPVTEQVIEEKRKQRMISRAKLRYHERKLRELHTHLDQGTFPKSLKLKASVNMKTPEGQSLIHEACKEVQKIMLIQMAEDEQQALTHAQKEYQSLHEKTWKPKPKEEIIKTLQNRLESMRAQRTLWKRLNV